MSACARFEKSERKEVSLRLQIRTRCCLPDGGKVNSLCTGWHRSSSRPSSLTTCVAWVLNGKVLSGSGLNPCLFRPQERVGVVNRLLPNQIGRYVQIWTSIQVIWEKLDLYQKMIHPSAIFCGVYSSLVFLIRTGELLSSRPLSGSCAKCVEG